MKKNAKIKVREAGKEEIKTVVSLSDEILRWLETRNNADYFGGVDEEEVFQAMLLPSKVLVAVYEEDGKQEIIGFTLLQVPNYNQIIEFQQEFGREMVQRNTFIINEYGVKPEFQGSGIAKLMMEATQYYALSTGHRFLIGTVHPDNEVSKRTLIGISKRFITKNSYLYHMRDGRNLLRQNFCLDLM